MNRTDAPKKQAVPFAVNGQREELLPTSPAGDNTASYDAGFPAVTMILKAAGGLPPKGQDMNQILFELSSLARWFSTGSINSYDATFSAEIGGYPKGAIVLGEDGNTRYMSTAEANTSDPNTDGAGWFNLSAGYLKTENNLSEIKGAGPDAVATALANLGLVDIALAGVIGGQLSSNGHIQIPAIIGGVKITLLIQWGEISINYGSPRSSYQTVGGAVSKYTGTLTFPVAFPAACFNVVAVSNDTVNLFTASMSKTSLSSAAWSVISGQGYSSVGSGNNSISWISIGY